MIKKITILIIMLLSTSVFANTPTWYQVEMLVFENNDPQALAEHWPMNPGAPSEANLAYLKNSEGNSLENYLLLPEKAYQLNDAEQRLKHQGHRMVFHRAWKQQIGDEKSSQKIKLTGGKRYNIHGQSFESDQAISAQQNIGGEASVQKKYEMDGTLSLNKSRYIHVNADILFHKPMKLLTEASARQGFGAETSVKGEKVKLAFIKDPKNWQNEPNSKLQAIRLTQSRRMKSNEVHYIDHPFYGVLISVTPIKSGEKAPS